eukprot:2926881-Rhodomonas_salina.2
MVVSVYTFAIEYGSFTYALSPIPGNIQPHPVLTKYSRYSSFHSNCLSHFPKNCTAQPDTRQHTTHTTWKHRAHAIVHLQKTQPRGVHCGFASALGPPS